MASDGKNNLELKSGVQDSSPSNPFDDDDDPVVVNSAVVKIQSTFRGKKVRSQLKQTVNPETETATTTIDQKNNNSDKENDNSNNKNKKTNSITKDEEIAKDLSKMQVSDNKPNAESVVGADADEAQKAATKIQAGFKGYKTRKELEGKLGSSGAGSGASGGAQKSSGSSPEHTATKQS